MKSGMSLVVLLGAALLFWCLALAIVGTRDLECEQWDPEVWGRCQKFEASTQARASTRAAEFMQGTIGKPIDDATCALDRTLRRADGKPVLDECK